MAQTLGGSQHAVNNASPGTQVPNNLPPRDAKFTGRVAEMNDIHALLGEHAAVGINQIPISHIHGGMGKSALAVAYGWQHLNGYLGGVYFVNAASGVLISEIAKLAELLEIEPLANEWGTAVRVSQRLASGQPALIIFDGLDSDENWQYVQKLSFQSKGKCRCLMTTSRESLNGVTMFQIGGLLPKDGVRMLSAFRADATHQENEAYVSEITAGLHGDPFGLTLVGGYMSLTPSLSWMRCRDQLTAYGLGRSESECVDETAGSDRNPFIHDLIDHVLESLNDQQLLAIEYAAHLPNSFILTGWLRQFIESEEAKSLLSLSDEVRPSGQQIISELLSLQLLRPQSAGCKLLTMPRLLRARLENQFRENSPRHEVMLDQIVGFVEDRLANPELALTSARFRGELTAIVEWTKALPNWQRLAQGAQFANQLSRILHALGRFREANALLEAYFAKGVVSQIEPTALAVLLSDKAVTLKTLGDAQNALGFMERAIQIEQKHLPPDHPVFATHYSNLAGILKSLGRLSESRNFIEQAIEVDEKHLCSDHPTLGLRHWWLGDIELAEGHENAAFDAYTQARDILSQHYPLNHPHVRRLKQIIDHLDDDTDFTLDESLAVDAPQNIAVSQAEHTRSAAAPETSSELFQPADGAADIQISIKVSGGDLAEVTKGEVGEQVTELHRQVRRLRVFLVEVNLEDQSAPSAKITAWGRNVWDVEDGQGFEPAAVGEGAGSSVALAVDAAVKEINPSSQPFESKTTAMKTTERPVGRRIAAYAGAAAVAIALLVVLFLTYKGGESVVDDAAELEKHFRSRLVEHGLDPEKDSIHIPLDLANEWYCDAVGLVSNSKMLRHVGQLAEQGKVSRLQPISISSRGPGILWRGKQSTIDYSLSNLSGNG